MVPYMFGAPPTWQWVSVRVLCVGEHLGQACVNVHHGLLHQVSCWPLHLYRRLASCWDVELMHIITKSLLGYTTSFYCSLSWTHCSVDCLPLGLCPCVRMCAGDLRQVPLAPHHRGHIPVLTTSLHCGSQVGTHRWKSKEILLLHFLSKVTLSSVDKQQLNTDNNFHTSQQPLRLQ